MTELSTHLQGQLVTVLPAYVDAFDRFAVLNARQSKARQEWRLDQVVNALSASRKVDIGAYASFSGSLAWPYIHPRPQCAAGLIEMAFDELAKRW